MFDGNIYQQREGTPMGSSLEPAFARYIDDTLTFVEDGSINFT